MFTVRWEASALNELMTLWTEADSALRASITSTTHQIDQDLQSDPKGHGESRPGNRRILFHAPLGITYRIEADGQMVSVLRVWLFRKRGHP